MPRLRESPVLPAPGPIRDDLQAHLALARVAEQPPTSLPVRKRTSAAAGLPLAVNAVIVGGLELLHEGIPLPLIHRQLGHSHLSTAGTYPQGISSEEIISTVHARRAPMMHASAGLAP